MEESGDINISPLSLQHCNLKYLVRNRVKMLKLMETHKHKVSSK